MSPHRVRFSQPPVPSVACVAEDLAMFADSEQNMRSVHRETCRPQGRPHSLKSNAASSTITERSATVSNCWKPKRRNRYILCRACSGIGWARFPRGRRGHHRAWYVCREAPGTWEAPRIPDKGAACRSTTGRDAEPKWGGYRWFARSRIIS